MERLKVRMKQNCFFIPKLVFTFLGISVNQNKSFTYKCYTVFMLSMGTLYAVSNLHLMLHNLDDYDIIMNSLFNFVGGVAGVIKGTFIVWKSKQFANIFKTIETLDEKYGGKKWSQMELYNANKKILPATIFFFCPLLYFDISTLIGRIINNDDHSKWKLPIIQTSIINTTYSPNFEIGWVYHVIAPTVTSSTFCMSDVLIAGITINMTIQFKIFQEILRDTFKSLNSNDENDKTVDVTDSSKEWPILQKAIKKIVIHHLSLIDLAGNIEEVCSVLVFIGVISGLSITSFSLYYASVLPPLDFSALISYFEVSAVIATLFVTCYCGTELSKSSESIANICYEIDFIGTDVRFQKSLLLIMMRSQKPVRITVGKFAGLSIEIFAWFIRSIYTYFMVLRKSNASLNKS